MAAHHEIIANSLTRDILSGRYRPGERLPSERDLAGRFDVNRGAVREAVKTLQQLGIVDVQPGGARVASVEDASFDVIGKLLEVHDLPDPDLLTQVLAVIGALYKLAAETAIEKASDAEIKNIAGRARRMREAIRSAARGSHEEDMVARFELMRAVMEVSGNLATRIVSRSLLTQVATHVGSLVDYYEVVEPDRYVAAMAEFELALRERDRARLRDSLDAITDLSRETILRAIARATEPTRREAAGR